jgi:hypothetical protein
MEKNKKISKTIIILFSGILGSLFFSYGCYSCVPDSWQVETARNQISEAISFVDSNKEFLDMLLDIQIRIRSYNEHMQSGYGDSETSIIGGYKMTIQKENLDIYVRLGASSSNPRPIEMVSDCDILTAYEKQRIEDKLLEVMPDESPMIIQIPEERVSMSYYYYERATIYIVSPSMEFELQDGDSYLKYNYAEKVNDDWCVYLEKAGYD